MGTACFWILDSNYVLMIKNVLFHYKKANELKRFFFSPSALSYQSSFQPNCQQVKNASLISSQGIDSDGWVRDHLRPQMAVGNGLVFS
jgi:hypothetical protein